MRVGVKGKNSSRVPGLVVVKGEEGDWRVRSGEVVFVTQVQDAQLASGADLSSERGRHPHSQQDQQATGQQQTHQQPLQTVGGGYRAPIQPEALLAILEVLLRLHPLAVHPHGLAGVGQGSGQIPGLPMAAAQYSTRLMTKAPSERYRV